MWRRPARILHSGLVAPWVPRREAAREAARDHGDRVFTLFILLRFFCTSAKTCIWKRIISASSALNTSASPRVASSSSASTAHVTLNASHEHWYLWPDHPYTCIGTEQRYSAKNMINSDLLFYQYKGWT